MGSGGGARARCFSTPEDPWHYVDLIALQGLIAHQRGEWFDRFRQELRQIKDKPRLASALFDAHLCVAEYLLYGPIPYREVIDLAEAPPPPRDALGRSARGRLRDGADRRGGTPHGRPVSGGERTAEAVELHHDIDAPAGRPTASSGWRKCTWPRVIGTRAEELLNRALLLARWSVISNHLLQRIYGSIIAAAPDAESARAVVDRAEATLGENDRCPFCAVMLAVPASIACADVGDLQDARRHLAVAQESAARWEGSAWDGAVLEARAHLARAENREGDFALLAANAAQLFTKAGHARDAARCAALSARPSLAPAGS